MGEQHLDPILMVWHAKDPAEAEAERCAHIVVRRVEPDKKPLSAARRQILVRYDQCLSVVDAKQ